MISLKDFKERTMNQLSIDDLGKFKGGYDAVQNTDQIANPKNDANCLYYDRIWFNKSYDWGEYVGPDQVAANYALFEPNGPDGFYWL